MRENTAITNRKGTNTTIRFMKAVMLSSTCSWRISRDLRRLIAQSPLYERARRSC